MYKYLGSFIFPVRVVSTNRVVWNLVSPRRMRFEKYTRVIRTELSSVLNFDLIDCDRLNFDTLRKCQRFCIHAADSQSGELREIALPRKQLGLPTHGRYRAAVDAGSPISRKVHHTHPVYPVRTKFSRIRSRRSFPPHILQAQTPAEVMHMFY